jgi:hypothetical protein
MALSWESVLREAMSQRHEMVDATIISCGDETLSLPVLVAQRKQDPHNSTYYDSFAVQHGDFLLITLLVPFPSRLHTQYKTYVFQSAESETSSEATVHVWFLSANASDHRVTIANALRKERLSSTVFVIVVDLSRPWRVAACLER